MLQSPWTNFLIFLPQTRTVLPCLYFWLQTKLKPEVFSFHFDPEQLKIETENVPSSNIVTEHQNILTNCLHLIILLKQRDIFLCTATVLH